MELGVECELNVGMNLISSISAPFFGPPGLYVYIIVCDDVWAEVQRS